MKNVLGDGEKGCLLPGKWHLWKVSYIRNCRAEQFEPKYKEKKICLCEDTHVFLLPHSKIAENCENVFLHWTNNYGALLSAKNCKTKNIKIMQWIRNNFFWNILLLYACTLIHSHNIKLITFLKEMAKNGLLGSLRSFSPTLPLSPKAAEKW